MGPAYPTRLGARIPALDALRGIAALVVALHHMRYLISDAKPAWIRLTPLRVFEAGDSAVIVFFVLSGFVLYLTFSTTDRWRYRPFAIKRVLRIYPPFAGAILLSAALWFVVKPAPQGNLSDWTTHYTWQLTPTLKVIVAHLLMLDPVRFHSLDNVMWSLVVEMRISLIFPLLAFAVRKSWLAACLGSGAISVASIACYHIIGRDWLIDPFQTLSYLYLFVIGAAMAANCERLNLFTQTRAPVLRILTGLVALVAFSIQPDQPAGVATAAGASLLVLASFTEPAFARPAAPLLWLGRVSYSLYLIQVPILVACAYTINLAIPTAVALVIDLALILVGAEIFHRLLERPAIRLSRYLTRNAN
jgi:peptidoglycan/LPS O-acetylase OafA/YrhL